MNRIEFLFIFFLNLIWSALDRIILCYSFKSNQYKMSIRLKSCSIVMWRSNRHQITRLIEHLTVESSHPPPHPRVRIPIWSVMIVSPIPLVMMSVLTAKVIWILLILIIFYLKHTYTKFTIHPLCIYIIFLVQMYIFFHFIKDPSD